MTSEVLLDVNISVAYRGRQPVFEALQLQVERGEILGLVGGSGCGKSTLLLAILRLLDVKGAKVTGSAMFNGRELLSLSERQMRLVRGKEIGLILQSPLSALNPVLRLGRQMQEAWRAHESGAGAEQIAQSLDWVGLPTNPEFLKRYPSEISVGQAQRVLIAMAILHRPNLLMADEPTSALDPITQAGTLELFNRINTEFGMTILLVSHNVEAIDSICKHVAVLHEGRIVEFRTIRELRLNPSHAYTRAFFGKRTM